MNKYDKIYVPHPTGDYEVSEIGFDDPERGRFVNEDNMIVCSIEELKEVWAMGNKNGQMIEKVRFGRPFTPAPDFEQFIKEKGINIQSL